MEFPVTTAYVAGLIGILQYLLMLSVGTVRGQRQLSFGDGGDDAFLKKIRRHGNLAENAALFIVLLALLELSGANATLVAIFGGLTIYFDNEIFIKLKPTILYTLFSITLLGGYAAGKPFLKNLMEAGFPPIEDIAWLKMSRNWGFFFID